MFLPLLALTLASLVQCQTELLPVCSLQPTSSVHVGMTSSRNKMGNWVAKAVMVSDSERDHVDAYTDESWAVNVDANTKTCDGGVSTLNVILTLTAPLPKLGPGYELFQGLGYYKFHNKPLNWTNARKMCAEEGAHLVTVNSEKEDDVIKELHARSPTNAGSTSNDWTWVGVERKNGKYFTVFGDALDTTGFTRWNPGQPTQGANDNCIMVHRTSGGLGAITCQWILAFTCEREL